MIRLVLPDTNARPLAFFLAMEEWAARQLPDAEYFFTWIVNPTVIIGRNQDIYAEVDVQYCRDNKIDVVRRRSGGGCVYADSQNIMMSYITADTAVEKVFGRYTSMVAEQLRNIGINAEPSGRNDITVDGRKISGNAYYLLENRSIVHGTMLFHSDMTHILRAITPSKAKLESHSVKSVEARITTIKNIMPTLTLDYFHQKLTDGLETDRYLLTAQDIEQIKALEQRYYNPNWIYSSKSI